MIPLKDNQDVASFLVTKHSWRGKYKRVFSIGTHGITTYTPDRLEVTNTWLYSDIVKLTSTKQQNALGNEFTFHFIKKDQKTDSMKFSSEHKSLIMTEAFKYRHLFAERPKEIYRYQAYKHHWSGTRLPIELEVGPCALEQLDPSSHTILASYPYHDIQGILPLRDVSGGFVIAAGGFFRLHLFSNAHDHQIIINKMLEMSNLTLGFSIKVLSETITLDDYHNQRFGEFSGDQHQTSLCEFVVHKVSPNRHMEPMRRTLCLSDTCLLERDVQTYTVVCLRRLKDVFALIRDIENPQKFSLEYMNGHTRTYISDDRDALLATLLDGVRSAGQRDVHVRSLPTVKGYRLGPLRVPVDEETESAHLRLFQNPVGMSRAEVIERFNANVGYSGLVYSVSQDRLFSENKEKLITGALSALVNSTNHSSLSDLDLEAQFHALRRLCASKVGFAAFTALPGFREWIGTSVVSGLRRGSLSLSHAALDAICALMQPMHSEPDLRQEQLNKASMLSSPAFLDKLLDMWAEHVVAGTGALVVAAMLDFLTFALCVPYSETTDGKQFDQLLDLVAARGRILFKLFEHSSLSVVKGAGLVMRSVVQEGSSTSADRMRSLSLSCAALGLQLREALFGLPSPQRHLARHLVAIWTTSHPPAYSLLQRIIPSGLLAFLESTEAPPAIDENYDQRDNLQLAQASIKTKAPHWEALERQLKYVEKHIEHYAALALQHWAVHMSAERKDSQPKERVLVLRRRRERVKATENWTMFYYQFHREHALNNLIWNHTTREELRTFLDNELRAFASDRELAGDILTSWNHSEIQLHYQCLQNELKIGDYYLRILLEHPDRDDSPIRKSYEFFNDLYHRFLSTPKVEMKCMCLQAMSIVYGRYYEDIGPFADTKYIVQMLDRTCDRMERDRLVQFLSKLILHKRNVSDLLEWNGIKILVELMTLSHLHTSRAIVPAHSNVIEGGPSEGDSDREWFYNVEQGDKVNRAGPVSFAQLKELYRSGAISNKTKCWAHSMEGWRALGAIPQLKWSVVAKGVAYYDESALAAAILDLLVTCARYYPSRDEEDAVIRPLPKLKRLLSEPAVLAHVVQLLLTFDPIIVEKVATLLNEVMQDNPEMSKLYLTGVFYFMLLYTGSNVLPIARFLRLTHMKQAFRADPSSSDIMHRSILGQLLPEAMVCYLENHGSDKFAQIYLGEYDTPEAIWNSEMRRMLMMKISSHIGEFTPRLRAHIASRYPYLAIPVVRYPQLNKEIYCNTFYLRHLCDTARFPDWPIKDPVRLLKEVLEAWRREVEKKPSGMSVTEAYSVLGLTDEADEAQVRKAYHRMAQTFHPDKNPQGRDRFEAANKAYEFLCSSTAWTGDGPNTDNIVLILRTQTILFQRYSEVLSPYKYAGYKQLLLTARLEASSSQLFASPSLLPSALELAHATLQCSPLNAEELTREGGLEILHEALARCSGVLTLSSKPKDVSSMVCVHAARSFAVAAQFEHSLNVMSEMTQLPGDLVSLVKRPHLSEVSCAGACAIAGLCSRRESRIRLCRAGAIQALVLPLLLYDYTLPESGLSTDTKASKQELANNLSKACVLALSKLYGPHEDTCEEDEYIVSALKMLLTDYLCSKLKDTEPHELLKTLTSNWRNPHLVWDNSTRAELTDVLSNTKTTESGPLIEKFKYSAHDKLVPIGGVFIDIYNEQPDFVIENPQQFIIDLLKYIKESTLNMTSDNVDNTSMALKALSNVITKNPGMETKCIGHFKLLFSLLHPRLKDTIQQSSLKVILSCSGTRECVEDISTQNSLGYLLYLVGNRPPSSDALSALSALLANTSLVKEALAKGAVLYLLDHFINSKMPEVRETCVELLARMMSDKLHGPKVRLTIHKYLPPVFSDAMIANPLGAVHTIDTQHEHPELVWTDHSRSIVAKYIAGLRDRHQKDQQKDPNASFEDKSDVSLNETSEVIVSGVYIRLFLNNPQWNVRNPTRLLQDLVIETTTSFNKDSTRESRGELCAHALSALLRTRPTLGASVAAAGSIPSLLSLTQRKPLLLMPTLKALAHSQPCVQAFAHTDVMSCIKSAVKSCREVVGVASETLAAIFTSTCNTDALVLQALESDLVTELLSLLESGQSGETAAQIVLALKSMSRSPMHGEAIRARLDKSRVWSQYAAQKHDLFITSAPQCNSITGVPQTAGYLTAPPSNITAQPPPID